MQDISLHFDASKNPQGDRGQLKEIRDSLSAVLSIGKNLFLASDETATLERLRIGDEGKTFSHHTQFQLDQFVHLPAGDREEIDIEGMDYDGNYLWIVGSHSLKRQQPIRDRSTAENIKCLASVCKGTDVLNRHLLARIPLIEKDGEYELSSEGELTAAQLEINEDGNCLIEALSQDKYFKTSLKLPGKDNGFDIEGLAVSDRRIFLGLRGPVLRGWATILELEVTVKNNWLKLKKIGSDRQLYKKHFLQLGGLGVRDLLVDDRDLLILAGPTMNLDGPMRIFRWHGALDRTLDRNGETEETLTWQDPAQLSAIQELPYGQANDRAEGMTFLSEGLLKVKGINRRSLLVVYDSPNQLRRWGEATVKADLFSF